MQKNIIKYKSLKKFSLSDKYKNKIIEDKEIKTCELHSPSNPSIKLNEFVNPITHKTVNNTER